MAKMFQAWDGQADRCGGVQSSHAAPRSCKPTRSHIPSVSNSQESSRQSTDSNSATSRVRRRAADAEFSRHSHASPSVGTPSRGTAMLKGSVPPRYVGSPRRRAGRTRSVAACATFAILIVRGSRRRWREKVNASDSSEATGSISYHGAGRWNVSRKSLSAWARSWRGQKSKSRDV